MSLPETLSTARLLLRRPHARDAAPLFEHVTSSPAVTRYLRWEPHASVDVTAERLQMIEDEWRSDASWTWLLLLREAPQTPIGMFTVWPTEFGQELGYCLSEEVWGDGLMTETVEVVTTTLFDDPDVVRVWATCDLDNVGSQRVLEKTGFQREGVLRKLAVHPNVGPEPRDCALYARIRADRRR